MKKILILLITLISVSVHAQQKWNDVNECINVIPPLPSVKTFVLQSSSVSAIQHGMGTWVESSGGAASYQVYTALLTQSGMNAPVATVLENTTGDVITYGYNDVGVFNVGAVTLNFSAINTVILFGAIAPINDAGALNVVYGEVDDGQTIKIHTKQGDILAPSAFSPTDGLMSNTLFEFRIYP